MSVRDTIRDDPTARKIIQATTITITLAMATPGLFSLLVISMLDNLPQFAERVIDHLLPFSQTIPGDIVSIIVGATPAVVAGVCYTAQGATNRLNRAGVICATIAIVGFVSSVISLTALRSDYASLSHIGAQKAILNLSSSVEISARSSLFYLAIFFGIGGASNEY